VTLLLLSDLVRQASASSRRRRSSSRSTCTGCKLIRRCSAVSRHTSSDVNRTCGSKRMKVVRACRNLVHGGGCSWSAAASRSQATLFQTVRFLGLVADSGAIVSPSPDRSPARRRAHAGEARAPAGAAPSGRASRREAPSAASGSGSGWCTAILTRRSPSCCSRCCPHSGACCSMNYTNGGSHGPLWLALARLGRWETPVSNTPLVTMRYTGQ
jgi:hypothetical protein